MRDRENSVQQQLSFSRQGMRDQESQVNLLSFDEE